MYNIYGDYESVGHVNTLFGGLDNPYNLGLEILSLCQIKLEIKK